MTRVIVHAGFHKTGTSSLQTYLGQNRKLFRPWFDFYGQGDRLHRSAVTARTYAQFPFPWRLAAFRRAFRAELAAVPEAETIVLSREHFSGLMPGHRRWNRRMIRRFTPAAVPIGRVIVAELRRRFGPDTRVEFLFTTREREAWFRSVHGHLLRSIHLTDDAEAFRARFPGLIDLETEAQQIGARVRPDALHVAPLESVAESRFGPAAIVLDLAGVPEADRDALPDAARANTGDAPALRTQFLDLNRSGRSKGDLKRMVKALRTNERQ